MKWQLTKNDCVEWRPDADGNVFHSPGGATQSLFFVDCHFIRQGAPLNYRYFAQFSTNVCFLRMSHPKPHFRSWGPDISSELCCQPQNRSATSLTTLILLVSVGFVQFHKFLPPYTLCSLSGNRQRSASLPDSITHNYVLESSVDWSLYINIKKKNYAYSNEDFTVISLRLPVPWISEWKLYMISWLSQNLSNLVLKQLTFSADTT